jgi:probable rRNA maturation factor
MGVDGPTDVLSFPLMPPSAFAAGAALPDVPRPPRARLHLGDIVVSVERAIDQAETGRGGQTGDRRWSPADELRLLVTHGVLHVGGWDHATAAEETAMRDLERRVLSGGDAR